MRAKLLTEPANTPGSGRGQDEGQAASTELQAYVSLIVHKLDEAKIYPEDSIFREEQGRVVIAIEIRPNGAINSSQLVRACPFESLNRAALETVKRLRSLPPLPGNPWRPLKLQVPILYELSRR